MRNATSSSLALLAAAALALPLPAAEVEVVARLEPQRIGLDDTATLTVEVRGAALASVDFSRDMKLDNLELAGGPSRSSQLSLVNGQMSRSESVQWLVRPLAVGAAGVRQLEVHVGGQVFAPADLALEVVEGSLAPSAPARPRRDPFPDPFASFFEPLREPPAAQLQPKLFLRAEVSPKEPFVGQQVFYTLYLFSQTEIAGLDPDALPDFRGFWVHEIPAPERLDLEIVELDGERYGRVALLRRALFPLHAGEVEIPAASVRLAVRTADPAYRGLLRRTEELRRTSNPLRLAVRSLPPAPLGFNGAVGRLQLAAELVPERVAVGEAATLSLTLSGEGHLQGLAAPALPPLPGVEVFPPQQEGDEKVVGNRVQGRRTWSWVLVPERAGDWSLGSLALSFFDPETASFRSTSAPELRLAATGGPAPQEAAAGTSPQPVETAAPEAVSSAGWRLPWAALLAAGVGLGLGAGLLLGRRSRSTGPTASPGDRLAAALNAAEALDNPRQAASTVEQACRDYLAERWQLDPGTPVGQWAEALAERGVPAEGARNVSAVVEDLHYLRYAPQLSAAEDLRRELLERCRKLRQALE